MSLQPSLTTPQQQVLALIACGFTATIAAHHAGVHRNTVANWLRTEHFRSALEQARADKDLLYRDQAETLAASAIESLRILMTDPGVSDFIRLRATVALLNHTAKFLQGSGAVMVLPKSADEILKSVHKDAQPPTPAEPEPQPSAPPDAGGSRDFAWQARSQPAGLKLTDTRPAPAAAPPPASYRNETPLAANPASVTSSVPT
ncbi:MAG TPA: hypothetical protein VKR61_05350 [Bryobacteraceae bacterium]|nr:hypothetical protein [Bryobacteraceae bacterium]